MVRPWAAVAEPAAAPPEIIRLLRCYTYRAVLHPRPKIVKVQFLNCLRCLLAERKILSCRAEKLRFSENRSINLKRLRRHDERKGLPFRTRPLIPTGRECYTLYVDRPAYNTYS